MVIFNLGCTLGSAGGVLKTLLSRGCTPDLSNLNLWRWEPDSSSFKSSPGNSDAAKVENVWELKSRSMFRGMECVTEQTGSYSKVDLRYFILSYQGPLKICFMTPSLQLRKLSLSEAEPHRSQSWKASQGLKAVHQAMLSHLCSVLSTSGGTYRIVCGV